VQQWVLGTVEFNCSFQTSIMAVTASHTMSFSYTDDTLFGPPLLQSGIKRVLQVLGGDLMTSLGSGSWLSAAAVIRCPGDENPLTPAALEECHNNPTQLEVTALSDASLADTGIWHNNSIFVNATLQHMYEAYLGEDFTVTPTPAVISMTYACHFQKRKPALNFIISVLVADLSLFATFWAIFSFVASSLARCEASPDHDVETGSTAPDSTSESSPVKHRSTTTEYIEMGSGVLAPSYSSETMPMIYRGSAEELMAGERG